MIISELSLAVNERTRLIQVAIGLVCCASAGQSEYTVPSKIRLKRRQQRERERERDWPTAQRGLQEIDI